MAESVHDRDCGHEVVLRDAPIPIPLAECRESVVKLLLNRDAVTNLDPQQSASRSLPPFPNPFAPQPPPQSLPVSHLRVFPPRQSSRPLAPSLETLSIFLAVVLRGLIPNSPTSCRHSYLYQPLGCADKK